MELFTYFIFKLETFIYFEHQKNILLFQIFRIQKQGLLKKMTGFKYIKIVFFLIFLIAVNALCYAGDVKTSDTKNLLLKKDKKNNPEAVSPKLQKKIIVASSTPILAELAKYAGGEMVSVWSISDKNFISKPDKPDKTKLSKLSQSSVFFSPGLKFEPWIIDLASTQSEQKYIFTDLSGTFSSLSLTTSSLSQGEERREIILQHARTAHDINFENTDIFDPVTMQNVKLSKLNPKLSPYFSRFDTVEDPLFFIEPKYAVASCQEMARTYLKIDAGNKGYYRANIDNLKNELSPIILKSQNDFSRFRGKSVALCGESLSILISSLGLKLIIIPSSIINIDNPNSSIDIISKADIKTLFYTNPDYKQYVEKVAISSGFTPCQLSIEDDFNPDNPPGYIAMLTKLYDSIKAALPQQISPASQIKK